ncbi:alpha-galactosidase [Pseudoruegeria sp. SHC-113]|uniref:alpha-galactosidase n=1 Tax=Pseudoruegeria sp. SHC-113 TaxID=2855439 RepID=UPI0021BA7FFB|nr:alpha-galactosidase [Pseudoruegeria sp. SHC-113]MCT8158903.1 alpha-galactosidase [Pseudoruegeria sp. SHC-113]
MRIWRLDDGRQSLAFAADTGLPEVFYWGAALPEGEDLQALYAASRSDVTGGMLDDNPPLTICPESSATFPGQPGLRLRDAKGHALAPRFALRDVVAGMQSLSFDLEDAALGLRYSAAFSLDAETKMLTAQASLESEAPVIVEWFAAPVLPAPQQADEIIDFSGSWIGEFRENSTPWAPGLRVRESVLGRTDHAHFPAAILPETGANNTQGAAYALHLGWSGGHRMIAEELPDGRRQIQLGTASGSHRAPVKALATPKLYATWSGAGMNGCATAFQHHLRDRVITWPKPDAPRPVHYNCWEAIYFDHDLATLTEIADIAADLGAERFVLDDGWFGKRDDDTTSLGDWQIDPRKWPDGLTPLIDHVHGLGMSFGLWFEPEMVNEDSDLYRAHPDWLLGAPDQLRGRQQLVLNMALPEVRDYLYGCIAAVLQSHAIDYIKWDHNRVLPVSDAAQAEGFYDLLARLRAAFPETEIESCSSGGGRIDFGVMEHCQRVWLSDSNDALERQRIQHAAARFLPSAVTGSHVGPRHCHTSGRVLSMPLRAWTAAQRHMGFEMDPRELTAEEAASLKSATAWYKANRDWMMAGSILRLDAPDPAITAEQQIASDGSRFALFAAHTEASTQILPRPLRLTGLAPDARYEVRLATATDVPALSRTPNALKDGPVTLTGAALMQQGLRLPWSFPGTIHVVEGHRL